MSIADIFGTEGDGTALRELRPQKQGHRRHHRLVAPPIVERWIESEIAAREVADPRFIGAEEGDRWAGVTGGSNGVGDLRNLEPTVGFHWDPAWLIAVRDAESGERVLIDGDERANELQLAVGTSAIARRERASLITAISTCWVVRSGRLCCRCGSNWSPLPREKGPLSAALWT